MACADYPLLNEGFTKACRPCGMLQPPYRIRGAKDEGAFNGFADTEEGGERFLLYEACGAWGRYLEGLERMGLASFPGGFLLFTASGLL
jgi:hypothetical protein